MIGLIASLLTASRVTVRYLLMGILSLVLIKRSFMVLKLEYFSNANVMLSAVTAVEENMSRKAREKRQREPLRPILCVLVKS